jgi:hypothetical protein
MQSRSTPTALTLAHGRLEGDRANERDVAKAITPARGLGERFRGQALAHHGRGA